MTGDRLLDRWNEVDALVTEALDLPARERLAWLEQKCGDDAELLDLVTTVLTGERAAGDFLTGGHREAMVAAAGLAPLQDEEHAGSGYAPGDRIGAWLLVEEIGRGGTGTVYLAKRADGSYAQHAALKLLRRGLDTDDVLARFRAERQILASLNHPNIARLIEGGATEDGRPYLVMDLVDGEPVTLHADRRRLTVDQRLRLFVTIARAVQYAHRNLIVHRDIKPGNILVAADGEVKLLDFGIAKLLDDSASGGVPRTRTGFRLFTPEYASPEQVRGEPVTTASDVYQLGILLYRLLSGRLPARVFGDPIPEPHRHLHPADDLLPPSAAIAGGRQDGAESELPAGQIASLRDSDPRRLRARLRGDLDLIALAALRHEPERRYATAAELADDVERHLQGRPIAARPDTWRYRSTKLLRRHPAAAAAIAAGLIAVSGYVATLQAYTQRLEAERSVAEIERTRAESARGLAEQEQARAEAERDRTEAERVRAEWAQITAEEQRNRAQLEWARAEAALYGERLQTDRAQRFSGLLVSLFETLDPAAAVGAELYESPAASSSEARPPAYPQMLVASGLLARGVDQAERLAEDLETQGDLFDVLSRVHQSLGMYPEALDLASRTLSIRREALGYEHPMTAESLNRVGDVLRLKGRFREAEASHREALALQRTLFGDRHESVAASLNLLGEVLRQRGSYAEAEGFHREALAMRRFLLGGEHADVASSLNDLAEAVRRQHRFHEAVALHREALALRRALFGEVHPDVAASFNNVGIALGQSGDFEGAERYHREALVLQRTLFGDRHPAVAATLNGLGIVLARMGDLESAERHYRESLALRRALFDDDHPNIAGSLYNLGLVLREKGDHGEAEESFRQALAVWRQVHGEQHPDVAGALYNLGLVRRDRGDMSGAEEYMRRALAIRRAVLNPTHPHVAISLSSLGALMRMGGRWDEAETHYREALELRRRQLGEEHPDVIRTVNDLRNLLTERANRIATGPPG